MKKAQKNDKLSITFFLYLYQGCDLLESYVEAAFVLQFGIILLSLQLSQSATLALLVLRKKVIYAFVIAISGSFFFYEWQPTVILFIELCFLYCFFYYQLSTYFLALIIRFLAIFSFYKLFSGTIANYQYFPSIHLNIFPFIVIFSIIFVSLLRKGNYRITQRNFLYELKINNEHALGYLDSGNSFMIQGMPVIFVNLKVYEAIGDADIIHSMMHTIGNDHITGGKITQIQIKGGEKMKVVAVLCEEKFPMGANCLLNLRQMSKVDMK